MTMILYCDPHSPYARKAMILVRLKGIELEERGVRRDVIHGNTKGANPAGKIPALIREGFRPLIDSPVICEYLDSLKDTLLPPSGEARFNALRLHAMGDAISDATYNYRFETVRDKALHWPEIILRQESALRSIIKALDQEADDLAESWDFGTLAIVCGLDYMGWRAGHIDWRSFAPKLAKWHAQFEADPIWQATFVYNKA